MNSLKVLAHAKINWTLDIIGQRSDGYHLMDMLMQSVTLSDEITLHPSSDLALTTGGSPLLPADEKHLALRAARALKEATQYSLGASIHVEKRIPVGAGMGGGSADAAAVLIGLNALWNTGLNPEELETIGLTLGADVPFCIRGGLARVTGIGEKLLDLPCARCWPLVVIQPCEGLSTKEIFTAYHASEVTDRPDTSAAMDALLIGDAPALGAALGNVLQPVSERQRPQIHEAVEALKAHGAFAARMTGSGSAVFGAFTRMEDAERAHTLLKVRWEKTFLCGTCMESVLLR